MGTHAAVFAADVGCRFNEPANAVLYFYLYLLQRVKVKINRYLSPHLPSHSLCHLCESTFYAVDEEIWRLICNMLDSSLRLSVGEQRTQ